MFVLFVFFLDIWCNPARENFPSKNEMGQVAIEPLDTQVEMGPFRNGPVGDFLQTSQPICHVKSLHPKLGWDSSWNSGKLPRLRQPPKVPNVLRGSGRYIFQINKTWHILMIACHTWMPFQHPVIPLLLPAFSPDFSIPKSSKQIGWWVSVGFFLKLRHMVVCDLYPQIAGWRDPRLSLEWVKGSRFFHHPTKRSRFHRNCQDGVLGLPTKRPKWFTRFLIFFEEIAITSGCDHLTR